MAINISDNDPRVSYTATSGQTVFTVSFEFFEEADLTVYINGTEKTITTDYTVTGGDGSTGTVTLTSGATLGDKVVIVRDVSLQRTSDFTAGAAISREALNEQLDIITAQIADVDDKASRALQISDHDTAFGLNIPSVDDRKGKLLGFNLSTGASEVGPTIADAQSLADISADIATLADIEDGTDATDAIQTAASISSDISTVSGISSNVTTVAGISSNVTTVAGDSSNIGTVAGDSSDIQALGPISADIQTLADIEDGTNATSAIQSVATISANVTTVAGISGDVTTVAGISSDVTAVAGDEADIGTVATNISDINTAATNIDAITAASGHATTASTKATEASASATTATTKASEAATSATNAATSETNAATSETNASSSATAAASSETAAASAQTAAESARDSALAAFDNFDDKYLGSKTADPTVDNDGDALVAGALYFNSTDGVMKVYTGSAWVAAYASLSGALLVANNLSDIQSASSARTNLGLGTSATVDTGTSANQIVKLDASAKLPAVDGSQLTGIEGVPAGVIVMWSGTNANIPSGWALCDGTNSTPDLTDRFILGRAAASNTNTTGGSNTVTLATTNLPSHTHSFSANATTGGGGGHTPAGNLSNSGNHTHGVGNLATSTAGAHTHTLSGNTSNAGSHSHSGSTSNTGSHSHNVVVRMLNQSQNSGQQGIFGQGLRETSPTNITAGYTSNTGAHSHNFNTNSSGAHSHTLSGNTTSAGDHTHTMSGNTAAGGDHTHNFTGTAVANHTHSVSVSGTTGSTGSGTALTTTPKYFTLAYIMKTQRLQNEGF